MLHLNSDPTSHSNQRAQGINQSLIELGLRQSGRIGLRTLTTNLGRLSGMRLENSWPPEFSAQRRIRDNKREVEAKQQLCAEGDDLQVFFTDSGDTASEFEIEVLRDFCRITSPKDRQDRIATAQNRRSIWLDDRCAGPELKGRGNARGYDNPLTAVGLSQNLSRPRFNDKALPDASRRLICITGPDPPSIQALVETASCIDTPALRDAIHNHLTFQTSLAVKIPSAGIRTFQLVLHLPFFLVRPSPPEDLAGRFNGQPPRHWTDLSFLQMHAKPGERDSENSWGICEAQISCVVTGWDDHRWVGYGLVDSGIDDGVDGLSDVDLSFDPIAGGGELEAALPIWRPRDYWITILEIRIKRIRKEWAWLIYKVRRGVNQYVRDQFNPS